MIHFASRDAMDIDGMGDRVVEEFFGEGFLSDIPSLYELYNHAEEIKELDGWSDKSITSLTKAIEDSKSRSLERLLFGLGIKEVGSKTAKILAKQFKNLTNFYIASEQEYLNIDSIGPVCAKALFDYFHDEKNREMLNKLEQYGVNFNYLGVDEIDVNSYFYNKNVVLTGSLERYSRNELTSILEGIGAKVSSSVSKKTDCVIVGKDAGSKLEKAKQLGVLTMDEEEALSHLGKIGQ